MIVNLPHTDTSSSTLSLGLPMWARFSSGEETPVAVVAPATAAGLDRYCWTVPRDQLTWNVATDKLMWTVPRDRLEV